MRIILILLLIFTRIPGVFANTRDGLIGWWKLDDAGATAVDSSWLARNGTVSGTTIASNCVRSGCKNFAAGDSITYAGSSTFFPSNSTAGSISLWFKAIGVTTDQRVLVFITGGVSKFGLAVGRASGKASAFLRTSTDTLIQIDSSSSISTGTWYHLVVTGTTGSGILYLNGVSVGTSATVDSNKTFGIMDTTALVLATNAGLSFSGMLDDVRIYNRVLTQQEVLDLYNSGIIISGNGTIIKGNGTKLNY